MGKDAFANSPLSIISDHTIMQNWEAMPQANYEHNWYGMISSIKREPISTSYNGDYHLQKTSSMDVNHCSPTSPSTQHQSENTMENQNFYGLSNNCHPLGFNPLTPPGYPNAVLPQINFNQDLNFSEASTSQNSNIHGNKVPQTEITQSLTPSHTPPMDITPPKSPKSFPGTPEKDNEMSSNSNDSGEDTRFPESDNDDDTISKPKFNSHGKVKKFKCKQCNFTAIIKVDFWAHARQHIKPEKLLECQLCPFVTELKHHLEYHIRKHKNLKPFRCNQCSYSCVNKSMLNSHLKSHSKVYQYRCADCDYATKYCHSFKLHLRKYTHKPDMVLNEDGSPNPLIVIDVYGTRRGPKMKGRDAAKMVKQETRTLAKHTLPTAKVPESLGAQSRTPAILGKQTQNLMPSLLPNTFAEMLQQNRHLPFFPYLNLNLQMLAVQQQAVLAQLSPNMGPTHQTGGSNETLNSERTYRQDWDHDDNSDNSDQNIHNAMDLTQSSPIKSSSSEAPEANNNINPENRRLDSPTQLESITTTPVLASSKTSRRKGRAFRFEASGNDSHDDNDENTVEPMKLTLQNFPEESRSPIQSDCERNDGEDINEVCEKLPPPTSANSNPSESESRLTTPKNTYECKSCGIYFRDAVLHTIHMGYHSCDDEFKCNMCGEKCGDRLTFFVHIARFPHS